MTDPMIFEEFKELDIFNIKPNMYLISNFGRVYSKVKMGFLSPAITQGYWTYQLTLINGTRKTFFAHILVATVFVPNLYPGIRIEVNHKNLRRNDNCVLNLEWTTKEENIRHELEHSDHNVVQEQAKSVWSDNDTNGEKNGMHKWKESEVRTMLKAIEDGASYREALALCGFDPTSKNLYNINQITRGRRWKTVVKDYNLEGKPSIEKRSTRWNKVLIKFRDYRKTPR